MPFIDTQIRRKDLNAEIGIQPPLYGYRRIEIYILNTQVHAIQKQINKMDIDLCDKKTIFNPLARINPVENGYVVHSNGEPCRVIEKNIYNVDSSKKPL
jgi:hypothetical protein